MAISVKNIDGNWLRLFKVSLRAIPANLPSPCNFFLVVAERPFLLRSAGEILSADRIRRLNRRNVQFLYVASQDREAFKAFLWQIVADPNSDVEQRANAMREAAKMEAESLFTEDDIVDAVSDANTLCGYGHIVVKESPSFAELMPKETDDVVHYQHAVNTSIYSMGLARLVFGEDEERIRLCGVAGLLHDLGEAKVSEEVRKRSELDLMSREDWEEMKRHSEYGLERIRDVSGVPAEVIASVGQHHENYDGSGYPGGLKGEAIDVIARVVAICDIFDTLTSTRPNKKTLVPGEALQVMESMQPGRFDPVLFGRFSKNV